MKPRRIAPEEQWALGQQCKMLAFLLLSKISCPYHSRNATEFQNVNDCSDEHGKGVPVFIRFLKAITSELTSSHQVFSCIAQNVKNLQPSCTSLLESQSKPR